MRAPGASPTRAGRAWCATSSIPQRSHRSCVTRAGGGHRPAHCPPRRLRHPQDRLRTDQPPAHRGHAQPDRGVGCGRGAADRGPEHRLPHRPRGRGRCSTRAPGPTRTPPLPSTPELRRRSRWSDEVTGTPGLEGVVLRYGFFYGPGTYYAADGTSPRRHESAASRSWAPAPASSPSATWTTPPPRRWRRSTAARPASTTSATTSPRRCATGCRSTPKPWGQRSRWGSKFVARLAAGRFAVSMATELRGSSNAKAKRELGWQPAYASWRQGFRESLG